MLEGNYRVAREADFALHATAFVAGGHFLQGFVFSGWSLEFVAAGILLAATEEDPISRRTRGRRFRL
jgi:hypothetical protein